MKTKDGVEYVDGMTLYTISPNIGDYLLCEHVGTYQHGEGRWQSASCHGVIADSYASQADAMQSIISGYKQEIERLIERVSEWKGKRMDVIRRDQDVPTRCEIHAIL